MQVKEISSSPATMSEIEETKSLIMSELNEKRSVRKLMVRSFVVLALLFVASFLSTLGAFNVDGVNFLDFLASPRGQLGIVLLVFAVTVFIIGISLGNKVVAIEDEIDELVDDYVSWIVINDKADILEFRKILLTQPFGNHPDVICYLAAISQQGRLPVKWEFDKIVDIASQVEYEGLTKETNKTLGGYTKRAEHYDCDNVSLDKGSS